MLPKNIGKARALAVVSGGSNAFLQVRNSGGILLLAGKVVSVSQVKQTLAVGAEQALLKVALHIVEHLPGLLKTFGLVICLGNPNL